MQNQLSQMGLKNNYNGHSQAALLEKKQMMGFTFKIPQKDVPLKAKSREYNLTVQDIASNRRPQAQFPSQVGNYELPDTRAFQHKIHGQVKWDKNRNRKTQIEVIFANSKIPEKCVPGPNHYKSPSIEGLQSTKKFQWDKEKRNTIWDSIALSEKKKVGPADYENRYHLKNS